MTRPRKPPDRTPKVVCAGPDCDVAFEPKRSTARYHSATCRQRAARSRKAAAESVDADAAAGKPEHPLVRAVRSELEKADRLETFNGQLALQLARKLVNPEESGATALSKELRTVMDAALARGPEPPDGPSDEPAEADEVTRAREARERKAREAAGRA